MKLSQRQTVSESKTTFHNEFQYVIPAVYRRVVDEFIVELNLLRNQSEFTEDHLFSFGLVKSFEELTKGYKPTSHKEELFKAICKATGFDINNINALSGIANSRSKELASDSKSQSVDNKARIINIFLDEFNLNKKNYYSRITAIGLFNFYKNIIDNKKDFIDDLLDVANNIGLKKARVDKDINLYTTFV